MIKPAPYVNSKSPRKHYTMPASYGESKDQPSHSAPLVRFPSFEIYLCHRYGLTGIRVPHLHLSHRPPSPLRPREAWTYPLTYATNALACSQHTAFLLPPLSGPIVPSPLSLVLSFHPTFIDVSHTAHLAHRSHGQLPYPRSRTSSRTWRPPPHAAAPSRRRASTSSGKRPRSRRGDRRTSASGCVQSVEIHSQLGSCVFGCSWLQIVSVYLCDT